LVTPLNKMV